MPQFVLCDRTAFYRDATLPATSCRALSPPYVTVAAALQAAGLSHRLGIISELVEQGLLYLPETHGDLRDEDRQIRLAAPRLRSIL
jgi:hypothetical protein